MASAIDTNTPLKITIRPENIPVTNGVSPNTDTPESSSSASAMPGTFWTGEGPSFKDVLDTINPLQHIPIISSIYQAITGDTQSTGSKIAGGALFGGPVGLVASIFDSIIKDSTGTDIAGNMMAALEGKEVPALHTDTPVNNADGTPVFLSANQRASYNAYVRTSNLA